MKDNELSDAELAKLSPNALARTIYERLVGPVSPDAIPVRTCGDRSCVNPEHIIWSKRS